MKGGGSAGRGWSPARVDDRTAADSLMQTGVVREQRGGEKRRLNERLDGGHVMQRFEQMVGRSGRANRGRVVPRRVAVIIRAHQEDTSRSIRLLLRSVTRSIAPVADADMAVNR